MMNESNSSLRTGSVELKLNGETIESVALTVAGLLAERGLDPSQSGIAVALNGAVVPRSTWAEQAIREGDRIEVITAMQGG